jgi:anti-sigma factor RsiW
MWFLLTGPGWLWILVLPYCGWLLVRHRPVASYPTLTFVLAGAVIVARLFPSYSAMVPALGIMAAVIVLSALAARAVHLAQARTRRMRRGRKSSLSQVPPL